MYLSRRNQIYLSRYAHPFGRSSSVICDLSFVMRIGWLFATAMNRSRLRLIGLTVLIIGLATAEGIYWIGERAAEKAGTPDSEEIANSIQLQNQRRADREIEMGFGKVYVMVIHAENWWAALPGYNKAALVITAATVVCAGGCFVLAPRVRP